ncbi:MAG: hypothetical protein IJS81_12230 [Selenomonadaceae bacterium]|nr:hypothetical protein [Selenomonadaceae bacterium]
MRNWNTDKIIGAGLIVALFLKIIGDIAVALINGTSPPSDLPMNIVTGLAGYMGRSLLEKNKDVDKT